jgi:hypothetical protein
MKKSLLYLTLSAVLVSASCKKDDSSQITNLPDLKQTTWKGNLKIRENNSFSNAELNLSFASEKAGNYAITNTSDSYFEAWSTNTPLTYVQEGRILYVEGGYQNVLTGKWWLIDSKKSMLQFVRDIDNPSSADTLRIQKY